MGFGLHVGWAIEGAIGSKYKIDASYLSPNVNMASRLEAATKQFGTSILFSGDFARLLSPDVRARCRQIDCVTVKGESMALHAALPCTWPGIWCQSQGAQPVFNKGFAESYVPGIGQSTASLSRVRSRRRMLHCPAPARAFGVRAKVHSPPPPRDLQGHAACHIMRW